MGCPTLSTAHPSCLPRSRRRAGAADQLGTDVDGGGDHDNGFSANRREGDGTTPVGIFGFVYGFGSRPDPGMRGFADRRLRVAPPQGPGGGAALAATGTRIAMGPAGHLDNRL